MPTIQIKQVHLNDILQLQIIGRTTFFETFEHGCTTEDMQKYLTESFSIDRLKVELLNPESEFYFAILDDKIIGYLKLNYGQAQTELKYTRAMEIERIYVLKEFHGKKIVQAIYHKALEIALAKNFEYIWLGVWEENHRAIAFYQKNGFIEFDRHIFILGDDKQTDIMMKFILQNNNED